jgi:hypothetical protein
MIRVSKRFRVAAGCSLLTAACAAPAVSAPALQAPSASVEPPPRRPDAVVVEPPPAMPVPAAHADAHGVVALREPLSSDAVVDVVRALMDAWQHESLESLGALLTADAGPIEARARGRTALVETWRQRLRQHPYRHLEGLQLVRPERIEHFAYDELGGLDAPARPAGMREGEVYVRVPLEVAQVGGEKYFDDVIVLLLRREEGAYKIAAYGETE